MLSSPFTGCCIADFNRRIFDGSVDYEFVILPSEEGLFIGKVGIIAKRTRIATTVIISFLEADTAKGFVKDMKQVVRLV